MKDKYWQLFGGLVFGSIGTYILGEYILMVLAGVLGLFIIGTAIYLVVDAL